MTARGLACRRGSRRLFENFDLDLDHLPPEAGAALKQARSREAMRTEGRAGDARADAPLLGTFIVRSGVLSSVHAFATDPRRGLFILAFLIVVIGGSLALYTWRAPKIGLGARFDAVSRESMLRLNNVLFIVAMLSVLLGTLYPLRLDALDLGKLSVGPPYFDAFFVPLMAPAVFLLGIGPLARWKRRASRSRETPALGDGGLGRRRARDRRARRSHQLRRDLRPADESDPQ